MKTGYSTKWIYLELIAALVMASLLYALIHPAWWGWLIFSPLFLYLCFETVRKFTYLLSVDEDQIAVGSFQTTRYSVAAITNIHVWEAKGGRMAVLDFSDGRRLHFSDRLESFDELVELLRARSGLPPSSSQE